MKRLLLAATVLLSTASCDVDVAKITDTLMTSSRSDRETATRNSDFSEKQVWWKREKRKNGGQQSSFFPSPLFDKFESLPLSVIRYLDANGESQQDDSRKSGKEYLRYRSTNPIATDQSYFTLCNSRNKCLDRQEQSWEMQQPFYVEEPSWIEIDKDYAENQPIRRLKTIDPYVISRGKRIHGVMDHLKEESLRKSQNFDMFVRNCFVDKKNRRFFDLKLKNDEDYKDIAFNKGVQKIKTVPALIDLQQTSGQNFHSSAKIDDHRFEDSNGLFERPKSKRFDSNLDSNFDWNLAVKEILERLVENLECDSTQCRDHFGRAIKRTRLGDGREMLEDLLNKSDPFYVARGKRVPSLINESIHAIYANDL